MIIVTNRIMSYKWPRTSQRLADVPDYCKSGSAMVITVMTIAVFVGHPKTLQFF